ncbi:MAG: cupin domain-containing protein [Bacteroidota bacterium]
MSRNSEYWIEHLKLTKHIEGGYFSEVYQSSLVLNPSQLPGNFTSSRHCCTHIYFLLEKNQFSAFHRIKSDELWHFYAGDPLIVYEIDVTGKLTEHLLGQNPETQNLFTSIKAGSWFGARLQSDGEYSLVGCTVSPGFDYDDFELAERDALTAIFPEHKELIDSLCR